MQPRFILIGTSHAGNVGAAARALKVMGFTDLVLVAPRWSDVLQRPEAIDRASGATDVLAAARVVSSLDEALQDVDYLCATVMTPRDFGPPTATPREHLPPLAQAGRRVAFLFGCERYGMANDDVYRCHVALRIPTQPGYGSLNLAAAIQVIAYEWRCVVDGLREVAGSDREATSPHQGGVAAESESEAFAAPPSSTAPQPLRADAQAVAGLLAHWQQALVDIGFLDPQSPKKLMPRLNQLLNRAALAPQDIHILRGVAKAMQDTVQRAKR